MSDYFQPIIDVSTKTQTCVQATTVTASSNTKLLGDEILVKCLTNACYIRLGDAAVTVSATNGYYMAVGDEVRWRLTNGCTHLAGIRAAADGAISIAFGTAIQ